MPPARKRKSIVIDSDSEDDYAAPAKSARRKSSTAASSSKKHTTGPRAHEISDYIAKLVTPEHKEIQTRNCVYYKVKKSRLEKCTSCIVKQVVAGSCRFVNLRAFKVVGGKIDYSDYAFRSNLDLPLPVRASKPKKGPIRRGTRSKPTPPSELVVIDAGEASAVDAPCANSTSEEAGYVLSLIAPTFVDQLRREKRHEFAHLGFPVQGTAIPGSPRPLIRILSTPETRSLCDACATSIYMGSYLCGCCGLELCLNCWEEWEPSDTSEYHLPSRDGCSRRRRHTRDSMVFVSRAADGEILKLIRRVERRIPSAEQQTHENDDATLGIESIPTSQPSWPDDKGPKYLPTPKTHHSEITLRQFQALWRKGGVPLVLTGFLDRFKLPWDPAYFIAEHGQEHCFIHNCINGVAMESTVAAFFSRFSDPTCTESHKLKDWPPSEDFSTTFPKLFEDFESALPFPPYTARKGTFNLAAHFPEGYNAPDLGPKMYNAYPAADFLPPLPSPSPSPSPSNKGKGKQATSQSPGVKGTTNLHLDLTDAMNIMLFSAGGTLAPASSTVSKGIPLCGAIWDIFPPSASSIIRTYLNSKTYLDSHPGAVAQDDPIHRQCYYLAEDDLTILDKEYGVQSHRIFQNPGEAVFIPAGCCHQVGNRRSCVKVAVDFLTPENVKVCKGLVREAREMAGEFGKGKWGKEDVLQLWACLGFAWAFYDTEKETEEAREVEEAKKVEGSKDEETTDEAVENGTDAAMTDVGDGENEDRKVDPKGDGKGEASEEADVVILDVEEDPKISKIADEEQKPVDGVEGNAVDGTTVEAEIRNGDKVDSEGEVKLGSVTHAEEPETEIIENGTHTEPEAEAVENRPPAEQPIRTEVEVMKAESDQVVAAEAEKPADDDTAETTAARVKPVTEPIVKV